MLKRKRLILSMTLFLVLSPFTLSRQQENHTLIILDLSQSMKKKMGNMSRLDAARKVFREVLAELPENTVLALRLLGHIGDRATACQETALVIPFQTGNQQRIIEEVEKARALGQKTPLHFTLQKALKDFEGLPGKNKIILLSDGEETCQQDPEKLAVLFKERNIPVDTIGIGNDLSFSQLGGIALESGGNFYMGSNFEGLKKAFSGSMGAPASGPESPSLRRTTPVKKAEKEASLSEKKPAASKKRSAVPGATGDPHSLVRIIPLPSMEEEKNQDLNRLQQSLKRTGKVDSQQPRLRENPDSPLMHVEIIFDASGSMAQRLEGKTKMDLARKALSETLGQLDSRLISLSFRAFGHDTSIPQEDKQSCLDSDLLVDFGIGNREEIRQTSEKLRAHGNTPIARSLALAGEDLMPYKDKNPYVLLISDGNETCGGKPVEVIHSLRQKGIPVSVYVIGFDLEEQHKRQLQNIAQAGGGQYYDARSYTSLTQSLLSFSTAMDSKAKTEENRLKPPVPVEGGRGFSQAVPLSPGRYVLKTSLRKGEWRYFKIGSSTGQRTLIMSAVETPGKVLGEKRKASSQTARFTAAVIGPDRDSIAGRKAVASGGEEGMSYTQYMDSTGRGFFLAVGDDYSAVEEGAFFEIRTEEGGDIFVGLEAPEKAGPESIPLPDDNPLYGHLGLEDRADVFALDLTGRKISGRAGLSLSFTEPGFRFRVEVFDGSMKRLQRFTKLEGKAELEISFPEGQEIAYIKISDNNPVLYHLFSSYTLSIQGPAH